MSSHQNDSPTRVTHDQSKLIKYLDQFGKQINSRKSNNGALQQQLSSLSRAYNQAQQKLLETEKALMIESILLEKQRSVIDIYKQILNEEMNEDGILIFLQQLQQDQRNTQIYDELGEIKNIITRKKLRDCRKDFEEDRHVKELKKEIVKLTDEKRSICDTSEIMTNENYELKVKYQSAMSEIQKYKNQLRMLKNELNEKSKLLERYEQTGKRHQLEKIQNRIKLQKSVLIQQQFNLATLNINSLKKLLRTKLGMSSSQKQNIKQNTQPLENSKEDSLIDESYVQQLQLKICQLTKYKSQYKKLKTNNQIADIYKKEIAMLKLFISEDALSLFKEYQLQKLDCIETEIRNLAILEKNRTIKLEQCERDVWKYKIQLMKEDQLSHIYSSSNHLSQTSKSRMLSSRQAFNMIETFRISQQNNKDIISSHKADNQITQFHS